MCMYLLYNCNHRAFKVPKFLSSRPNWVPPPPHPQARVAPPLWVQGGDILLAGKGVGGPNSAEGTDTLVIYVQYTVYSPASTIGTYFFNQRRHLKLASSPFCGQEGQQTALMKVLSSVGSRQRGHEHLKNHRFLKQKQLIRTRICLFFLLVSVQTSFGVAKSSIQKNPPNRICLKPASFCLFHFRHLKCRKPNYTMKDKKAHRTSKQVLYSVHMYNIIVSLVLVHILSTDLKSTIL
jgi:hypothetical protein